MSEVPLHGAPTMVAADDAAVWVIHSDGGGGFALARIDPRTHSVTADTPLGGHPVDVAVGSGAVHVAVGLREGGGLLVDVDPETGRVLGRVPLPDTPRDLVYAHGATWVATAGGPVFEVDARRGVVGKLPMRADRLAATSARIWGVDVEGNLRGFDPRTGRRGDPPVDLGPNVVGLASGPRDLWAAQQRPSGEFAVVHIDLRAQSAPKAIPLRANGPGHLAVGRGYVWVVQDGGGFDGARGSVVRLDSATGRVVDETEVGSIPTGIAFGAGDLWVANFGQSSVSHLKFL